MGKHATKAGENIFTQARYNAAKFNDRLNSREGASEELGIDRSRLARIELGSNRSFSFAERRGNMNLIRARPVFLVYRNTQQNLTGEK